LRFLARFAALYVERTALLSSVRSLASSVGVQARNPKWTSYGALEIDLFSPSRADLDLLLSIVAPLAELEFVHDLNVAPPHKPDAELLSEARSLFNEERYWECHEVLEGVWRQKQGDEKRFLQGVILVCAAFVHHQKGEDVVAAGVMKRALPLLDYASPAYGGFRVAELRRNSEKILEKGRFSTFQV
jgi:uncharacterized protein